MKSRELVGFQRAPGHLIRRCHQLHGAMFAQATAAHGITSAQWAAVRALHDFPGVEQARLSDLIGYDRSTIGGLVDRLEAKSLVERSPDATDRRLKRLNLTPAGKWLFEELHDPVRGVTNRFVSPLSAEEVDVLTGLLERLLDREDVEPACDP